MHHCPSVRIGCSRFVLPHFSHCHVSVDGRRLTGWTKFLFGFDQIILVPFCQCLLFGKVGISVVRNAVSHFCYLRLNFYKFSSFFYWTAYMLCYSASIYLAILFLTRVLLCVIPFGSHCLCPFSRFYANEYWLTRLPGHTILPSIGFAARPRQSMSIFPTIITSIVLMFCFLPNVISEQNVCTGS